MARNIPRSAAFDISTPFSVERAMGAAGRPTKPAAVANVTKARERNQSTIYFDDGVQQALRKMKYETNTPINSIMNVAIKEYLHARGYL